MKPKRISVQTDAPAVDGGGIVIQVTAEWPPTATETEVRQALHTASCQMFGQIGAAFLGSEGTGEEQR